MDMSLIFDLPGAAVQLYKVIRQDRELADWIRLILSSIFSGFIALTGVWGGSLMAHTPPWAAFGTGLVASAVSVLTVVLRMKQGKSLFISIPGEVERDYEVAGQSNTAGNEVKK
jgi:hypothetical protein